jgi:dihydrofolate reductase
MGSGRITLYIATSLDGFVADEEGGVAWLEEFEGGSEDEGGGAGSYEAFFESVDCLVMGSRTYEQVLGFGEWPYGDRPTYVVTNRDLPCATKRVEFVSGEVETIADDLTREYDHVWLVGGTALARSFLDVSRVDEIRLSVVPILLGDGIPLFGNGAGEHGLSLLDSTQYRNGIVELHYAMNED